MQQHIDLIKDFEMQVVKLKIDQASQLARDGNYHAAENLLRNLSSELSDFPSALDLYARILAQQGKFHQAEMLWRKALALDPSNEVYKKCLDKIQKIYGKSFWWQRFKVLVIALFALLFLASCLLWIKSEMSDRSSAQEQFGNHVVQENRFNVLLLERINDLKKTIETDQNNYNNNFPFIELNIEGLITKKEEGHLLCFFSVGLFDEGVNLRPESRKILVKFGKELEKYNGKVNVTIFGTADNTPIKGNSRFKSNFDLGKERADVVYNFLLIHSRLIKNRLAVGSYGEYSSVFSNEEQDERNKNRSVVIKLSADCLLNLRMTN